MAEYKDNNAINMEDGFPKTFDPTKYKIKGNRGSTKQNDPTKECEINQLTIRKRKKPVHKCIGRILTDYGTIDNDNKRNFDGATGTVFKQLPNCHYLVLTCAHAIRKYDKIHQKEAKPKEILYLPKGESVFDCRMAFVQEAIYDGYSLQNDLCPNDLAIILVQDKTLLYYYDDINVDEVIKIRPWPEDEDESVNIFGYPIETKGLLQGQHGEAKLESDRGLWKYDDINTYPGQSGSAIYKKIKKEKKYAIHGVHTFGDPSVQNNCGVYLDLRKIEWIKDVVDQFESIAISRAPKESVAKAKVWYKNTAKLTKEEIIILIDQGFDNIEAIKCLTITDLKDIQIKDDHIPNIIHCVEQLERNDDVKYDQSMDTKVWLKDVVCLDEGDIQTLLDERFDNMVSMQSLNDKQLKDMKINRGHRKQILFYINRIFNPKKLKIYRRPKDDDSDDDQKMKRLDAKATKIKRLVVARQRKMDILQKTKTTMDDISKYILNAKSISKQELANIFLLLHLQHYDSDALEFDVKHYDKNDSNVCQIIKGNKGCELLRFFINHHKISISSLYKVGFDFKYWEYHRKCIMTDKIPKDEDWFNVNDYGGYSPHELYVERKYRNLKAEILTTKRFGIFSSYENGYNFGINAYKICIEKANGLLESSKGRRMKASDIDSEYHYNIKAGATLTIPNIMSIILFEDNVDLCTYFRNTFRKNSSTETLSSVKERNSEVWHWSKILRETITYFGKTGKEWNDAKGWIDNESGPFYVGWNRTMNITQFNIRIYEPMKLTKQIEVAMKFAENESVLQLNFDEYYSHKLRIFDSSWFSRYPENDSRLCFGGHYRMKLESIRIISTKQNFEDINGLLYLFDCMLNGTNMMKSQKIGQKKYEYIRDLITYFSKPADLTQNDVHQYILDTFELFIHSKTQIVINLWCINKWFGILKDLVIDSKNMLKPEIVDLFPNLKKVFIYSTSRNGKHVFPFDLSGLVSMIYERAKSNNIVIVVKARWPKSKYYTMSDDEDSDDEEEGITKRSWIQGEMESLVMNECNIEIAPVVCGTYNNEDCWIISKDKKWSTKSLCDDENKIDDGNTKTMEQCTLEDMLFILEKYAFCHAAKKENRSKKKNTKWSLEKYKEVIIDYFRKQKLNGRTFINKGKFDFVQELNSILKDEEFTVAIATLYSLIKHCDVNKVLEPEAQSNK